MSRLTEAQRTAEALYAALAKGDAEALAAVVREDFSGRVTDGMPLRAGGTHEGLDAMRDNVWWQLGRNYHVEARPESFHLLEDGRLLVRGSYIGSGRRSGKALAAAFHHLITIEGDYIVALEQLTDSAAFVDALDAPAELETISYSVRDGVARIWLNRPDERNAINLQLAQDTLAVAERVRDDSDVRAVLIGGEGDHLTVGGDIATFGAVEADEMPALLRSMTTPFHEGFKILRSLDKPIVTVTRGAVAGGGLGFVWAADLVIASDTSRFVAAFAALGLSGDGGGTWHLPRLVGPRKAMEMYLLNRPMSATEALDCGLVNEVVADIDSIARATEIAQQLASGPTVGLGAMRRLLNDSTTRNLPEALDAEIDYIERTAATADAAAAIEAFRSKRQPTFKGL